MQGSRIALLATAVALSGTVVLESLQRQRDVDVMAAAAANFLASLSSEQREQATFGFDSEERSRHHFIPPEVGMCLNDRRNRGDLPFLAQIQIQSRRCSVQKYFRATKGCALCSSKN